MDHEDRSDGLVEGGRVEICYYTYDRSRLTVQGEEFTQGLVWLLKAKGAGVGLIDHEFVGAVSGSDVVSREEFHLIGREEVFVGGQYGHPQFLVFSAFVLNGEVDDGGTHGGVSL